MPSDPLHVVVALVRVFDSLKIRYLVGGSVASSLYGIPRATQDVDFVAEFGLSHAEAIATALAGEFYVDPGTIREAVRRGASFNVVHLASMFKADVFLFKEDAWFHEEMARARSELLESPEGPIAIRFASPEDTLLHKLVWYRLGNEISDRQWGDILGILKVQGKTLDQEYLDRWAPLLDVSAQLDRARRALLESD
jgi:hypothetical protein